jgi:hypothetical protein
MPEVVEAKILNPEHPARTHEIGCNCVRGVGEDFQLGTPHAFDDLNGFFRQIDLSIVADLLARVFHVPHENALVVFLEVIPGDLRDFDQAPG